MDFKKPTPTEHPSEDIDRRFEGPSDTIPAPRPQAQPMVIAKKKSSVGYKVLTSLLLILLITATGYSVYAYMNEQSLRTKLSEAEAKGTNLTAENNSLVKKLSDTKAQEAVTKELTTKEKIELAVSNHVCNIDKFGCDKVTTTITKSQDATTTVSGFAVTEAKSGTGAVTKVYLKSTDGINWVVIYEGQTPPSQEVIKRYAIPTGFAS